MASQSYAVEQVAVQGLFSGKAVLMIDGTRHIVAVGETSPEGVRVISADAKSAMLEVNGEQKQYFLANTITTQYAKPKMIKEQIMANKRGMYLTYGSINGHSVHFLVDTGATTVALSANKAKSLGIQYRLYGKLTQASTASGVAKAWEVKLKSVQVGRLKQSNVTALVIDGSYPTAVLLGMSFLDRVRVSKENGVMILEQKN